MFENIGQKLKTIAKVVFAAGAVVSVVGGLIIGAGADNGYLMLLALVVMALGAVGAWICACLVYGFGELICRVTSVEKRLCGESGGADAGQAPAAPSVTAVQPEGTGTIGTCGLCDTENVEVFRCVIRDQLGTRHRTLCRACMEKTGAEAE